MAYILLYVRPVREEGNILFALLLVCLLSSTTAGQGIITFDDDFFESPSGKAASRPEARPSRMEQFGCTSVVGNRESSQLMRKMRPYCRGKVRRVLKRNRQHFVPFSEQAAGKHYYDVCCLPRRSGYQRHRWR